MSKLSDVYLDHRVVQVWGVDIKILKDADKLLKAIVKLANILNLTIVDHYIHKFDPHGLSLVLIIAQSHLAVHTWPEFNYMHFDIVSCSRKADLSKLEQVLKEEFKPQKILVKKIGY